MKKISVTMALAALGLLLTGTARATTLYTPPASAAFADAYLYCNVVNVGTTAKEVRIEAHDYAGNQVDVFAGTLQPGTGNQYSMFGSGIAYCKFIFTGSKSSVRGSVVYVDNSTGANTVTIPAQ